MLKLDLLPAHFAIARLNKKLLVIGIVVLLICAGAWGFLITNCGRQIADTQAKYDETKAEADKVRKTEADTTAKEAELKPIADKVMFIESADRIGGEFFDKFHKINRFIYNKAEVHNFTITPPGSVSFTCTVGGTTECARFLLNFIRCPYVTGITISGLPKGMDVKGVGGAGGGAGAGGPVGAPGGPGGAPGMPGGMPGMPGGAPSGPPPGMSGGMPGSMPGGAPPGMPGGMPGAMPGGPAGAPGAGGGAASLNRIDLTVTCQLVDSEKITVPTPPGAAAAGGAPGGMPGMPGAMPAGGPPGAPGASAGGPPGAPPGGAKKGAAKGGDDEGGGGKKSKGGGEE